MSLSSHLQKLLALSFRGEDENRSLAVVNPDGSNVGGAAHGSIIVDGESLDVESKSAVITDAGATAFITAVAGEKVRVLAYRLQAKGTGEVTVEFHDTAGSPAQVANSPEWVFQTIGEGVAITAPAGAFEFETDEGDGLQIDLSAGVSIMAHVVYVRVPVA